MWDSTKLDGLGSTSENVLIEPDNLAAAWNCRHEGKPELAHPFVSRLLLSGLVAAHSLVALKIDLGRSHANNPQWLPHARFHVVWQTLNLSLLGLAELALIWWPGRNRAERFYLAACLTATTLVAFWGALASTRLYSGALFDQNGILPLKLSIRGRIFQLEMNTMAVLFGSIVLVAAVAMY